MSRARGAGITSLTGAALGVEGHGEAMLVVIAGLVAKDGFEVVATENERPVEALFPHGPYPALRDRVRQSRSTTSDGDGQAKPSE